MVLFWMFAVTDRPDKNLSRWSFRLENNRRILVGEYFEEFNSSFTVFSSGCWIYSSHLTQLILTTNWFVKIILFFEIKINTIVFTLEKLYPPFRNWILQEKSVSASRHKFLCFYFFGEFTSSVVPVKQINLWAHFIVINYTYCL